MQLHFLDVAASRDALIRGDLEEARRALGRVAEAQYGDDLPVDWLSWVGEVQDAASHSDQTVGIEQTARAVAELTASCADCHRTTLGGPAVSPDAPDPFPVPHTLEERMKQHAWGANQLWLGLTAPSHEAWVRGARAVAGRTMDPSDTAAAEHEPTDEPTDETAENAENAESAELDAGPNPFVAALEETIEMGYRLEAAGQPAEMTALYGELLAGCASCHTRYHVVIE